MSIYLDSHESIEQELLFSQSLQVERIELNPERADIWWLAATGQSVQIENKQAGEALGSLDSVEEQLTREMAGADYTMLSIRGMVTPSPSGMCQVWGQGKNPDIMFRNREYQQPYAGYAAFKARLWELGVPVIEVPDLLSLVSTVVAVYNNSQKPEWEHKTFQRFIKQKSWIMESDPVRRAFILTCMHVEGGGWSEETADACATWMTEREVPLTMVALIHCLKEWSPEMSGQLLRSAGREGARQMTIGPSRIAKMKGALGL